MYIPSTGLLLTNDDADTAATEDLAVTEPTVETPVNTNTTTLDETAAETTPTLVDPAATMATEAGAPYDATAALIDPTVTTDSATYVSPFTKDATTGELSGQPTAPEAETYYESNPEVTVAGQLEGLLDPESALNKVVAANAAERATALGMESSSMAVGAAQKALIESALPIAQQDAETAATFQQSEQALANEQAKIETEAMVAGELTLQKARIAETQTKIAQQWETTIKGLDANFTQSMTEYQAKLDTDMAVLQGNINKELYAQQVDATVQTQIMTQSQEMLNDYQVTVQQLMANETFLNSMNGSAETMRATFDEMFTTVSSSITFAAKAAGVYDADMQNSITAMISDNQWS